MAQHAGVSHTTVQRIWHAHELKPHLVRTFKLLGIRPMGMCRLIATHFLVLPVFSGAAGSTGP